MNKLKSFGPNQSLRCLTGSVLLLAFAGASGALLAADGVTAIPLIGDAHTSDQNTKIPTGSEAFTVQLPAPAKVLEVSVTDFGASSDRADNTKAFNDAIAHCAEVGASRLTVPKGIYRFTEAKSIAFDKLTDFEFDGNGSTFVYNHPTAHCMVINECTRTLFKNFSIDWDWDNDPLASTVKVENRDPSGAFVDLKFIDYQRFPKRDIALFGGLLALDPATMSAGNRNGGGLWFGEYGNQPKVQWVSDNVLRMYSSEANPHIDAKTFNRSLKDDVYYRLQHRLRGDGALNLNNDAHITVSDVNIYSAPGAAIFMAGDQHHCQLLRTNVIRPPGTKRPVTSLADHCDLGQTHGYFKMEDCEISFGGDDCFCVIGGGAAASVKDATTTRAVAQQNPNGFHVGDPVEVRQDDYTPTGYVEKITAITTVSEEKGIRDYSFAKPLPVATGKHVILFNKRFSPKNIILRNCYFHDNQARGALLKGDNITVENCRFEHNELGAVHIYTGSRFLGTGREDDGADGCGASNVVLRNNTMDNENPAYRYGADKMPVIYIFAYIRNCAAEAPQKPEDKTKYPILRDILIEGNKINGFPGAAVSVGSAENVIIRNNVINADQHQDGGLPYRGSINVSFASKVFVSGNRWSKFPGLASPCIYVDQATSQDIYWNDNSLQ